MHIDAPMCSEPNMSRWRMEVGQIWVARKSSSVGFVTIQSQTVQSSLKFQTNSVHTTGSIKLNGSNLTNSSTKQNWVFPRSYRWARALNSAAPAWCLHNGSTTFGGISWNFFGVASCPPQVPAGGVNWLSRETKSKSQLDSPLWLLFVYHGLEVKPFDLFKTGSQTSKMKLKQAKLCKIGIKPGKRIFGTGQSPVATKRSFWTISEMIFFWGRAHFWQRQQLCGTSLHWCYTTFKMRIQLVITLVVNKHNICNRSESETRHHMVSII